MAKYSPEGNIRESTLLSLAHLLRPDRIVRTVSANRINMSRRVSIHLHEQRAFISTSLDQTAAVPIRGVVFTHPGRSLLIRLPSTAPAIVIGSITFTMSKSIRGLSDRPSEEKIKYAHPHIQ